MARFVAALVTVAPFALLLGCVEANTEPQGLRRADKNPGATVVFDLEARPLPEIPFPNDVATRVDPESPTGKRINVSTQAPTELERGVRQRVNQLDGFGTYAPIYVSFTAELDLRNLVARHHEDVPDLSDDAVYLVNVDPDSPDYGTFELVDLGRGNFPGTMKKSDNYFDFDPRAEGTNLLFESAREVDANENGRLDPLEDTDDDGVWDRPNTLDPKGDPLAPGQMLTFYERETNTLIVRPLRALRPQTTYAVVLTRALLGADGHPINSPFDFVNHTRQTQDLEPLREILPKAFPARFDSRLKGVRFAWTFTTQSTTLELETIRAGLYGHGPMSWLSRDYPARLELLHRAGDDPSKMEPTVIRLSDTVLGFLVDSLAGGLGSEGRNAILRSLEDIDYVVSGSYVSPYFLTDRDGLQGSDEELANNREIHDEDEAFDLDVNSGQAEVGSDEVTFLCVVPKTKPGREPPFPVVIYGHGYGSSRLEGLGFAGQMAKFGLATCAIDNVGHGLNLPSEIAQSPIVTRLLEREGLSNLLAIFEHGRHRDLTNDGVPDSGGDYWTADTFHTRDMVRQTTVDYMQFIRVLRSFDGRRRFEERDDSGPYVQARSDIVAGWDADEDGEPELAGDFNGDGVVDLGGEQPYYAWGQSLGGIQSAVLVGIDPAVRAAAPTAGGAGLADIAIRSTQTGVPEAVILRMEGPIVLGRPLTAWDSSSQSFEPTGTTRLEFLVPDAFRAVYLPFAEIDDLRRGDRIVLRNLAREAQAHLVEPEDLLATATVRDGAFRTSIAADAIGANERRTMLGFDPAYDVATLHRRSAEPRPGLQVSYYRRPGARELHSRAEEPAEAIDFSWNEHEAPAGLDPSAHAIRFEGVLDLASSGEVRLRVEVVGRVRIAVDGRQVLDLSEDGEEEIELEAGTHELRVDYDRTGATGKIRIFWAGEGRGEQILGADALQTHRALDEAEREELSRHVVDDARELGDGLVVEVWSEDGELKRTIDTFERDVVYQNILYPKGTPLAALAEGWGLSRQTPSFRRFFSIAQIILEKADPANYAPLYFERPLRYAYETPSFRDGMSNVLVVPTNGDSAVPVNTGISIARIAGIVDATERDARYDKTANNFLIDSYVYEAVPWLDRFAAYPGALFDPDDLDRGRFVSTRYPERGDDPNPDAARPLRAMVHTERGISAMRIPYLNVEGRHGFDLPKPDRSFDIDTFMTNQIGYYFATGGEELRDDVCLEAILMDDCSFYTYDAWQRPHVR